MSPAVPVFVAVTAVGLWQVESQRPPKRPDRPFRLFVFAEAKGEQDAVGRIRRAEEECKKIAKRRKDWFVVVESREQAEIVMEIQAYWVYEDFRTESSPLSGTPVNVSRENHHLFAQVNLLGGISALRVDDGRRLTGAASKLMGSLEELCKKDYWQILGRRDPPGIAR